MTQDLRIIINSNVNVNFGNKIPSENDSDNEPDRLIQQTGFIHPIHRWDQVNINSNLNVISSLGLDFRKDHL